MKILFSHNLRNPGLHRVNRVIRCAMCGALGTYQVCDRVRRTCPVHVSCAVDEYSVVEVGGGVDVGGAVDESTVVFFCAIIFEILL